MADSTLVAMKGIINRLRGFAALTAYTTPSPDSTSEKGIFSSIPQQKSFPYVLVEIESQPFAQNDGSHMQHLVRVHGYSDTQSPEEAMQMRKEVYNALDRQEANITIDSGSILMCIYDGVGTAFKERDGTIWHSVVEFKFIID